MRPVLGYWDLRGLCEPIRFLLHYVGEDYEDKKYTLGPPPEFANEWFSKDKHSLGLLLPNIPYYIDDKVKISQSHAILHYLCKKYAEFHLGPENEEEVLVMDQLEGHLYDMKMDLVRISYFNPDFENLKVRHLERLQDKLECLQKILQNQEWLVGNRVTYVDFLAYDSLDFQRILQEDCLDPYPLIKEYLARFERLPAIEKYMTSGSYHRLPIFAPMAAFGNKREE